ncbi:lipase 1 [Fusarium mundagurra]|uniref:Carboxylic ester hydrolase n=1 Tax=Fusarium mundagurra TaxID=1567541 RepID=A0A8H6DQ17_9HYPO|nr:lipase 1 [Fusarium mundagurra]
MTTTTSLPPVCFSTAQGLNTTWDSIRTAHEYPVHCSGYGYDQDGFEQSEDCLYLNIVRPAGLHDDGLPVAAWIDGGGLEMGGAADPRYNLSFIVKQSGASQSSGLVSITASQHSGSSWVKRPRKKGSQTLDFVIKDLHSAGSASFGGDPEKVTIFGESSGAESVAAQMFAYNGQGAIGQSGFGAPLGRYPGGFNAIEATQNTYDDFLRAGIKSMRIPYEVEKTTGKTRDELFDELLELYPNDQSIGIPSLETWPHAIRPGDDYAKELGLQYRRVTAIFGDFVMHYQRCRANEAWAKHGVPCYAYRFNIMPTDIGLRVEWDISKK